jgi:hypothetical protein
MGDTSDKRDIVRDDCRVEEEKSITEPGSVRALTVASPYLPSSQQDTSHGTMLVSTDSRVDLICVDAWT